MTDAAMDALERRYSTWARGHALAEREPHHFEGRIVAREVAFTTGLGGSAPNPPEIVVDVELPVVAPVLLKRSDEAEEAASDALGLLRELLDVAAGIRNVGVTSRFVRITFEPGTESDVFEAALGALEERLRLMKAERDLPYRG